MHRAFFICANQAAEVIGVGSTSVHRWACRQVTPYNFPLRVVKHGGHNFIAEADVRIAEQVQREFPMPHGRLTSARREQMKRYAEILRAAMTPRA